MYKTATQGRKLDFPSPSVRSGQTLIGPLPRTMAYHHHPSTVNCIIIHFSKLWLSDYVNFPTKFNRPLVDPDIFFYLFKFKHRPTFTAQSQA